MAARRRRREEEHEEHDGGQERWLVTYADMLTLLMVLFIVMFAMSNVDQDKYEGLKNSLADGFGNSVSILNGAAPQVNEAGGAQAGESQMAQFATQLTAAEAAAVEREVTRLSVQQSSRAAAAAQAEVDHLTETWAAVEAALAKEGLRGDVRAQIDSRGLVISLVSRHIIFEPNMADLTVRGRKILNVLAPVLAQLDEPIALDGHTNQAPGKPKYYDTDWDLSSARAITALRWLNERHNIPTDRLQATGFGHTKPLVDPKKKGSQDINKRVDVIVLSQAPAETRERFNQVHNSLQPEYTPTTGDTP